MSCSCLLRTHATWAALVRSPSAMWSSKRCLAPSLLAAAEVDWVWSASQSTTWAICELDLTLPTRAMALSTASEVPSLR